MNQKGFTLLEMLVAIIIFILASLFIVDLVANAIDKPKEAAIMNDLNHYEESSKLLLTEVTGQETDEFLASELNKTLDKNLKLVSGVSETKTPYNNNYKLTITTSPAQIELVFTTKGKKDSDTYTLAVIKEGKVIESCTNGFGRNNKNLVKLTSDICKTVEDTGNDSPEPPDETPEEPSEETPEEPSDTGSGTIPEGFVGIYTDIDLNNVRDNLQGNYILMDDIDLSNSPLNTTGYLWDPIGTDYDACFKGVFDGNNYTISGLRVSTSMPYAGLFGCIEEADVKKLTLTDADITSSNVAGILAGMINDSSISDIEVIGDVHSVYATYTSIGGITGLSTNSILTRLSSDVKLDTEKDTGNLGGLVGQAEATTVSNSFSEVSEIGGDYGGGLIGQALGGKVTNSQSIVTIVPQGGRVPTVTVGGLVGKVTQATLEGSSSDGTILGGAYSGGLLGEGVGVTVRKSFATVDTSGEFFVGGVAGIVDATSTLTDVYSTGVQLDGVGSVGGLVGGVSNGTKIERAYATGRVTGMIVTGGLVGDGTSTGIKNSFYDSSTTGQNDTGKGTSKTTVQMKQQATYVGWDFNTVWKIEEGLSYPTLR